MTQHHDQSSTFGTTVDVCICTYQRAELRATLLSVDNQKLPENTTVRMIVADNDLAPSARAIVDDVVKTARYPVTYIHSPGANISIARNACLDAASGDYVAFIDDDEVASDTWLAELLRTTYETGADAVLGPVRAHYTDDAPGWMAMGDFHSTFPVWVEGDIKTGYTCNTLLRRTAPSIAGRRFDLALGRSGGEDTSFFTQMRDAGGTIAYAAEAWVHEDVPAPRARMGWLVKRRFRVGQSHGRLVVRAPTLLAKSAQAGIAATKAAYSFAFAALFIFSPIRRNRSLLRGVMHVGALSGIAGMREIEQYGQPTAELAKTGASHGS